MSISSLRPIWPWLTLLLSGALLAGAHGFQYLGGLQPCALCLDQRNWHWGVVALSVAALVAIRFLPGLARWVTGLLGLLLLGSAAQAAYHVAVEQHWVIAQCDVGRVNFETLDFDAIGDQKLEPPSCDKVAWSLFGVSMAGYNAIISMLGALASFAIALWPARKS
ncbi:MAG: disulfide bond formation protein B [Terricaulis sp.]